MRKIITWVSLLALLASALLLFSGCGQDDGTGKTFLFPLDAMPQRLDPAIAQTPDELLVVNNIFEGLVRVNEFGSVIPGAAHAWNVLPDGVTYLFHLREDSHWFLGAQARTMLGLEPEDEWDTQVTAHDFAFGLQRAMDERTRAPRADLLAGITSVEVRNRHTLAITLQEPDDAFLHVLESSVAMPVNQAFFEATRGRFGLSVRYLLSNGPFYLSLWESNRLRLAQHAGYVGHEEVAPATVNLLVQTSMNHRVNNLGVEGGWDAAIVPQMNVPDSVQVTRLYNATEVLLLNIEDETLRRVMLQELTAQDVVQSTYGLLPQGVRIGDDYLHNIAPPVLDDSFTLISTLLNAQLRFPVTAAQESLARSMVQAWQIAFGLDVVVTIEVLEPDALQARVARGQFDLAFTTLYARESSAHRVLQDWVAQLYDSELEIEPTAQGIRAAETHLLEQAVVLPMRPQHSLLLIAEGVTGFSASSVGDNVFFGAMRK